MFTQISLFQIHFYSPSFLLHLQKLYHNILSITTIFSKISYTSVEYLAEIGYAYVDWNSLNDDSMKKYSATQLLTNLKQSIRDKNTLIVLCIIKSLTDL